MEEIEKKGSPQPEVHLSVPESWEKLSQGQLKYAFRLIAAGASVAELQTLCLMKWAGLKLVCHYADGYILKHVGEKFYVDATTFGAAVARMKFLAQLPSAPVRLERIGRHKAVDASLNEVEFQVYLFCENLYQGFIKTHDENMLQEMGRVLYGCPRRKLQPLERMNVFYWWSALKQRLAAEFPHFFVTGAQDQQDDLMGRQQDLGRQLKESMNAQIRGLTKGDVTKEKEILAMDTWRALTELDAMAKEYQELQEKYGKH